MSKGFNISKISMLLALVVIGCVERDSTYNEDSAEISQEVIHGNLLNTSRVDEVQKSSTKQGNPVERANNWKRISLARATVEISSTCKDSGLQTGSGMLIGDNIVLTADHVVRARADPRKGCSATEALPGSQKAFLHFGQDRQNLQLQLIDEKPPNSWLLKNRLHSLSLFEANVGLNPSALPKDIRISLDQLNRQGDISYTGAGKSADLNNDIATLTIPADQWFRAFKIADTGVSTRIPQSVFYDFAPIPLLESELINEHDEGQQVFGLHYNQDPRPNINGDWLVDFSSILNDPVGPQGRANTTLISEAFLYEDANFASEQCHPSNQYGKFCVGLTMDNLGGSSGGAIVRQRQDQSEYKAVAVVNSGFGTSLDPEDNNWEHDQLDNQGVQPDDKTAVLSLAAIVDKSFLESLPKPTPPESGDKKYAGTASPTNCIGEGCEGSIEDASGKMITFTCAEAFSDINASGETIFDPSDEADKSDWKPGFGVGIIGGPMLNGVGDGTPDNIRGVGSLGLVCQNDLKDQVAFYHENWRHLRIVGLFRRLDAINKATLSNYAQKVHSLLDIIRNWPLEFNRDTQNGKEYLQRPIPMKFCPPTFVLKGIKFAMAKDGTHVKAIKGIHCESQGMVGEEKYFTLNPFEYGIEQSDAKDFIQYIGDPALAVDDERVTIHDPKCDPGEYMTGLSLYVEDNLSQRNNSTLRSLGIECQAF